MIPSEEQRAVRMLARDFASKEIAPHATRWEDTGGVPETLLEKLGDLGLMGMLVPQEEGGSGLDFVSYALVSEEIAAADCGICNLMNVNNSPVCAAIRDHGSDAQRRGLLRELASGKKRACFMLTEAHAGSDASAIATSARRRGDRFLLRGVKHFVTAGASAHVAMVVARSDPEAGQQGISCFLVPTDAKGYRIARLEDKLGHRNCDTAQVALDDVEVPEEAMLGAEGEGYRIALAYLSCGRIGVAAQAVGVARAALDAATHYAAERQAFGQPIIEHQAIAFRLADMATEVEIARNLTLHAAALEDAGRPSRRDASMAKLFATEMVERVTSAALQIHGGYGYLRDYAVEKYYRDARVLKIYEGSSEIQRMVIARSV